MILETIKAEGLAHLSYFLADEQAGVAAVIDPRRDIEVYPQLARHHGVTITYVLETHAHEDFVSGSRELAAQTGASVYTGPSPAYHYAHEVLADHDVLHVGAVHLGALHVPGHTPEHLCFVVSGGQGATAPWGVFTGDALFAGEVGRPDLMGTQRQEEMSHALYHALFDKLLPLGDDLVVYPSHGKGSPCGGQIGDRETTTLGYERRNNPRLQAATEDEFTEKRLAALEPAPRYYPGVREKNLSGPNLIGCPGVIRPLDPRRFEMEKNHPDTVVLDTRDIAAFGGAHLKDALNIALRRAFPIWAGWFLRPEQRILLVVEDERDLDTLQRHFLRLGLERVVGHLSPGMKAWFEQGMPYDVLPQMSVHELKTQLEDADQEGIQFIDVRRDDEWRGGHIPTARHVFLPMLPDQIDTLARDAPVVVYCSTGFRASIAASLLLQCGFTEVYNVAGGMNAWRAAAYPIAGVDESVLGGRLLKG